ncbi:hypothetical protein Ciccas_005348 [Cichlidogyrus casuarinus]|uniref:Uncharacterized protein n=1 Tax=Cichlidogyrus casuarinus TaxID=1844966 RepID=A0ABD2Q8W3_9PLAT
MQLRISEMHMHQAHIRGACNLLQEEVVNLSENLPAGNSNMQATEEMQLLNRRMSRLEKSIWSEYSLEKPLLTGAVLHLLKESQPSQSKDDGWSRDDWLEALKKKLQVYHSATETPPNRLPSDPDGSNVCSKPARQFAYVKLNSIGQRNYRRFSEATDRQYTAICDDIDLSMLYQEYSPNSSPIWSFSDLTQIGTASVPKKLSQHEVQGWSESTNLTLTRPKSSDDEMIRAEVAERAELKGVLLKRLRQLTKTAPFAGDSARPTIFLSGDNESELPKQLFIPSQSEEVGAFINQRLTEEEENVVDPDLDLDLDHPNEQE